MVNTVISKTQIGLIHSADEKFLEKKILFGVEINKIC